MTPDELVRAFRRALLERDDEALRQLAEAYAAITEDLHAQIDELATLIADAKAAGVSIKESWLYRQERYQALLVQAEQVITSFSDQALEVTRQQQANGILWASTDAFAVLQAAEPQLIASFAALPTGAIQSLIGFLGDGSPLTEYFAHFGEDAAEALRTSLVTGIARGDAPRVIASAMKKAVESISLESALSTARTEHIRVYNSASLETYRANPTIVRGWQWMATLSTRTCLFCLGQHGTFHELEEPFETHVRCRCTVVPATRSFTPIPEGQAQAWFDALTDDQQQAVAPTDVAAEALRSGELTLADYVGYRDAGKWGRVGVELSTKAAREAKAVRQK